MTSSSSFLQRAVEYDDTTRIIPCQSGRFWDVCKGMSIAVQVVRSSVQFSSVQYEYLHVYSTIKQDVALHSLLRVLVTEVDPAVSV